MIQLSSVDKMQIAKLPNRGLIGLYGADVHNFLQNLISNDVSLVSANRAIYALLLTPQGKLLHDFFVLEPPDPSSDAKLLLECSNSQTSDLIRKLTEYRLRAEVRIEDLTESYDVWAVFGPNASEKMSIPSGIGAATVHHAKVFFSDPRLKELGVRVISPIGETINIDAPESPYKDYELNRIIRGVPDGDLDFNSGRTFPLEAGLEELNAIDYGKGCYVGQELTARTHYRGTLRKRLFTVTVQGQLPERGSKVFLGKKEAGEVKSGQGGYALAMLKLEQVFESEKDGTTFTAQNAKLIPLHQSWMNLKIDHDSDSQGS